MIEDTLATIDDGISRFSAWLDATYPRDLHPCLVLHRRLGKVTEEVGEVTEAIGGYFGENPRKGDTHTLDDLQGEILDVAVAALGAWEHLNGNSGQAGTALISRIRRDFPDDQPPTATGHDNDLNEYLAWITAEFTRTLPGLEPAELSMRRRHADLTQAAGNLARELTAYTTTGGETVTKDGLLATLLNVAVLALTIHENTTSRGTTGTALRVKVAWLLDRVGLPVAK